MDDKKPKNIPVDDGEQAPLPQGDTPGVNQEVAPTDQPVPPASDGQPMPPPDAQQLKVKDSKTYGLTGLQKEVLQNFLNIQQLNQFQLRAHLQLLAEQAWGVKADQFVRFGLDLEQNQLTIEFLEPLDGAPKPPAASGGIEAAPPASAQ